MSGRRHDVCSVEVAGTLDNKIRKWLQSPKKILGPYVKEGMTALDMGCGPGVYTLEMARLVGANGRVFACDLQEGMLQKVRDKINGTDFAKRITLCKSENNDIGINEPVDFVLSFYMVHEVIDQERLLRQISAILKPNGHLLIIEPPLHVSRAEFNETIRIAQEAGLSPLESPKVFLSKTMLLKKM